MDDKNISFLSCIDDKMATLSAQERGLQAQNTYKRRQISPFGVRNPVFCGGKTLRGYFRIYGGDFLWSGYISESYVSFYLFFTLLRILAPGTLKTRVNRCFCSSNDRRRACLACRCSQTTPQSYAFSLKSLRFPPVFLGGWGRVGVKDFLIC